MAKELAVTIIGPGSLGTALARALHRAGLPMAEIVYRNPGSDRRAKELAKEVGARAVKFDEWVGRARAPIPTLTTVVWLCVGDSAIRETALKVAKRRWWKGATVFHSSGALASDELESLRLAGAKAASVHPMMTFVRTSEPSMKGVAFALEGDKGAVAVARQVVGALGAESFVIRKGEKALYHALGAFVSPLLMAQLATAERIGRELGLKPQQTRKIVGPMLLQTVRNYLEQGPAAAFSGPIVRGDAGTVRKNLRALRRVPGAAEIYRALAKMAVEELPSKDRAAVRKALNLDI